MVRVSFLKIFTATYVLEGLVVVVEGGLIDDRFLAVSVEWARVFLSTVAWGLLLGSQNLSIVGLDHIFHIPRAAGDFDVTMGAPDGAEVCELVGLYILHELSQNLPDIDFGLYRDDGLAVHKTISGPQRDRIRKKIVAVFQDHGLKIEIDTNLKTVNFLDITLNLDKSKYSP